MTSTPPKTATALATAVGGPATSSTTNYHYSEMPPWKIELIQRKKKTAANNTGGVCNTNANSTLTQYGLHHQNADNYHLNGCSSPTDGGTSTYNTSAITADYYSPSSSSSFHQQRQTSKSQPHHHFATHTTTNTSLLSSIIVGQMDSNITGSHAMNTSSNDDSVGVTNTGAPSTDCGAATQPIQQSSSFQSSSTSFACNPGHSHFQQQQQQMGTSSTAIAANVTSAAINVCNGNAHTQTSSVNVSPLPQHSSTNYSGSGKAKNETGSLEAQQKQQQAAATFVEQQIETPFHQLHSRHGSEHIASSATQNDQQRCLNQSANSYFSVEHKQQLHHQHHQNQLTAALNVKPTAKCLLNKSDPVISVQSTTINANIKNNNNQLSASASTIKSNSVLKKYLKNGLLFNSASADESTSKSKSIQSNWFPTKRNSLNLLVENIGEQSVGGGGSNKMVAMQELSAAAGETNNYTFDDTNEELQYGPGIVSKLRCRYLSLALRQSANKQRPSLDNLRRATSLNNLLDETEEVEDDVDEVDVDSGISRNGHSNGYDETDKNPWHINGSSPATTIMNGDNNKMIIHTEYNAKAMAQHQNNHQRHSFMSNGFMGKYDAAQKPPIGPAAPLNKYAENRCRQTQRGNDSLKRARSVEALMRYDTLAWRRDMLEDSDGYPSSNPVILDEIIVSDYQSTVIKAKTADSITIEDKIQQARERIDVKPPKRLTSFMDETERPPPDLVKQTLLKFEATANRRPRGNLVRYGNGDVAAKVATYKTKLSQDKQATPPPLPPTVMFPKPTVTTTTNSTSPITSPLSPSKKPLIKPRTTSPKPVILSNGAAKDSLSKIIQNNQQQTNGIENRFCNNKPSVDINSIKTNLEKANQKNAMLTTTSNGNGLIRVSPTPASIRIDTTTYRCNKLDSSLSPEMPQSRLMHLSPIARPADSSRVIVLDTIQKRNNPQTDNVTSIDSPIISQLTRKTENLLISTPKARPFVADLVYSDDGDGESIDPDSDIESADDGNSSTAESSTNGHCGSYDVNVSDSNDDSENGEKFHLNNKRAVKPLATENISKADTMSKFQFDGNAAIASPPAQSPPSINNKSFLPMISVANSGIVNCGNSSSTTLRKQHNEQASVAPPEPSVRQIGIIRPLVAEPKFMPPPPLPPVASARTLPSPPSCNSASVIKKDFSVSSDAIKVSVAAAPIVVSTQHSVVLPSSATSSSLVVTNSVSVAASAAANDLTNDVVVIECNGPGISSKPMPPMRTSSSRDNLLITNLMANNGISGGHNAAPSLTSPTNTISINASSIVHQKNLLNKEKSGDDLMGSGAGANDLVMIQSPIKWNIKKSTMASSPLLRGQSSPPITLMNQQQPQQQQQQQQQLQQSPVPSSKSWQTDAQTTNTMVFNFSNRKDVPDYIENDGLVIRRKRELPKPGESGFVLLGDLTVETSTDPEPTDDSWTLGDPPSPCDVRFQNDNVVINGKSSMRDKSTKDQKQLSIQFNEMLTSTFEYPSESSLSEDIYNSMSNGADDYGNGGGGGNGNDSSDLLSNGSFLGNTPIGSVPLGNYTPIKATTFNTNFELGVTRAQTSSPNTSASIPIKYHHHQQQQHSDITTKTGFSEPHQTNGTGSGGSSSTMTTKISATIQKMTSTTITTTTTEHQQLISVGDDSANNGLNNGDPESLQYLKPASDDQTVAWSEGASDLLF